MKRFCLSAFWAILFLLLTATRVSAETTTFQQDNNGYTGNSVTYLDRWNVDTNFGTAQNAWLRPSNQSAVIRYDLSSLTSTNALVQNARLRIFVISSTNANPITTKIYKLLSDWNENETTWHKKNSLTEWSWVGANGIFTDRADTPVATQQLTTVNTYYEYDITPLVREWVRYPQSNKGMIIVPESFSNVGYSIGSDNHTNSTRKPVLSVDYSISSLNDFYPYIQIVNPTNEAFLTGSQNITVNASDDRGIQQVNFYLDNTSIGSSANAPYTFNFNAGNYSVGKHTLKAVALDAAGQTAESAIVVYLYRVDNGIITIGQITDTHVGTSANYEPADKSLYAQRFQQGLANLNNVVKPAVIIHTGDIVTILDTASGNLARSIVDQSAIPVKTIAGNHDLSYPESFLYYFGSFNKSFDIGQKRFVGFSTGMLNESWVRGSLSSTSNQGIIFSHYLLRIPQGSTADPSFYQMPPNDVTVLQNVMRDHQVPAFMSGHLHQAFLLEDSVSHAVEIGGPTLSSQGTYEIITIDNGIVSSNTVTLDDWPAIVITSPQRFYSDGGTKEITGNQKIRAKIYDDAAITSVLYKIDDYTSYQPMTNLGNNVWETTRNFDMTNSGIHTIYVQATDASGRAKYTTIDVKVLQGQLTPTPTPTNTPTITPTPTSTGTPTPTNSPTPTPTPNPSGTILVNAGGPAYNSGSGQWSADNGFTGGQTYSVSSPIQGTSDPLLYQTERFNMSGYKFNVPNGPYTVTLKFAEIYYMCNKINCRSFNVKIEGNQVLTNFDIFKETGSLYKAVDKTFVANVGDGVLNIDFVTVVNASKISAIKIVPGGSITPTPTYTPTASPTPTATPTVNPTPTVIPTGSPTPTPTVPTPTPPVGSTINIDSGSVQAPNLLGTQWLSDKYFVLGQTFSTTKTISNTDIPAIYQTERFNMNGYNIPVANGTRTVTLKFAEIYDYCQKAGCRIFNVSLEGKTVLSNFDVYAQAGGGYKAIDKTFVVDVADGVLNIGFTNIKNAAKVNGIEVR